MKSSSFILEYSISSNAFCLLAVFKCKLIVFQPISFFLNKCKMLLQGWQESSGVISC